MNVIAIADLCIALVVIFFAAFALHQGRGKATRQTEIKAALWYLVIAGIITAVLFLGKCERKNNKTSNYETKNIQRRLSDKNFQQQEWHRVLATTKKGRPSSMRRGRNQNGCESLGGSKKQN
jgi:hypothetical protein